MFSAGRACAAALPVPVLVPVQEPGKKGRLLISKLDEKGSKAIVNAAMAIFRKWMHPEAAAAVDGCASRHMAMLVRTVDSAT